MINVITPVTRAHNLPIMAESLEHSEDVMWWIIYDPSHKEEHKLFPIPNNVHIYTTKGIGPAIGGNLHRNIALDKIPASSKEWVLSLDDDNIIVEGFFDELTDSREAIVVDHLNNDGTQRLVAAHPRVNHIDLSQYAIRRYLIGDVRYENRYDADGIFAETVYNIHPDKWTLIHKPLSYWNYLNK